MVKDHKNYIFFETHARELHVFYSLWTRSKKTDHTYIGRWQNAVRKPSDHNIFPKNLELFRSCNAPVPIYIFLHWPKIMEECAYVVEH